MICQVEVSIILITIIMFTLILSHLKNVVQFKSSDAM